LKLVGQPLIATAVGAGAGALATLWGGPTAVVGAALGGGGAAQELRTCQQQAATCPRGRAKRPATLETDEQRQQIAT
jgi:hypothetical protein